MWTMDKASAETVLELPKPGVRVRVSEDFSPTVLQGIRIRPDEALTFDFLINPGEDALQGQALEDESVKLIKYFMAALTVPEQDMWVNLSPIEANRIIPDGFGRTSMGRDLLAQDYILKQLTASLMYPEDDLGQEFWKRVKQRALETYGTTEIPMNTFNKVWIVPEYAVVHEQGQYVYLMESRLRVLLEEDYLTLEANQGRSDHGMGGVQADQLQKLSAVSSNVIREIILPEIEREVNQGRTFANLRQITNSVILATWYKSKLRDGVLGHVYIDQNKTQGVHVNDQFINQKIYAQYIKAFERGVYNYIKEEYDETSGQTLPRKYFSGGAIEDWRGKILINDLPDIDALHNSLHRVEVQFSPQKIDRAMFGDDDSTDEIEQRVALLRKRLMTPGMDSRAVMQELTNVVIEYPRFISSVLDAFVVQIARIPSKSYFAANSKVLKVDIWRILRTRPDISPQTVLELAELFRNTQQDLNVATGMFFDYFLVPSLLYVPESMSPEVVSRVKDLAPSIDAYNQFLYRVITTDLIDVETIKMARNILGDKEFQNLQSQASSQNAQAQARWNELTGTSTGSKETPHQRPIVLFDPNESALVDPHGGGSWILSNVAEKIHSLVDKGNDVIILFPGYGLMWKSGDNESGLEQHLLEKYVRPEYHKHVFALNRNDDEFVGHFAGYADVLVSSQTYSNNQFVYTRSGEIEAPVVKFDTPEIYFDVDPNLSNRPRVSLNEQEMFRRDRRVLDMQKHIPEESQFFVERFQEDYDAAKQVIVSVDPERRVLIKQFLDYVFEEGRQRMGESGPPKLVFLQTGARPLYELAKTMANVMGGDLSGRIHSIWANMGNNRAISESMDQAVYFVKYLYDEGIIDADSERLVIVDTDTRNRYIGTEEIFYRTLLNDEVIGEVNRRFGLNLKVWNTGEGPRLELLYMMSDGFEEAGLVNYLSRKGLDWQDYQQRMIVKGFNEGYDPDLVANLWKAVDVVSPLNGIEDEFVLQEDGRVTVVPKAPYGQPYEGRELQIRHHVQYAGFVNGMLAALEAEGYDVKEEEDRYFAELERRLVQRTDQDDEFVVHEYDKIPPIAITGVNGFLGSTIARDLAYKESDVHVLARMGRSQKMEQEYPRFSIKPGNLSDLSGLRALLEGREVLVNIAADSSTGIRSDNIEATAQMFESNIFGPALSLVLSTEENLGMRKIYISSFDVDKIPDEADAWVERMAKRTATYVKQYIAAEGRTKKSPREFMRQMAGEFAKQEFASYSYPMSKVLMDRTLLKLSKQLRIKNVIILRVMGLVGAEMHRSSNSGLLLNLINAAIDPNERPVGKKITPYRGATVSLVSVEDVRDVILRMVRADIPIKQQREPLVVEFAGRHRHSWEEILEIVLSTLEKRGFRREDAMRNIIPTDAPEGFVNVETEPDFTVLNKILGEYYHEEAIFTVLRDITNKVVDSAMLAKDLEKPENPGGIDLNPGIMTIESRGQGIDVATPLGNREFEDIEIDGFIPVIINVIPAGVGAKDQTISRSF